MSDFGKQYKRVAHGFSGFTVWEFAIVLAIVAVLALVAMPRYQSYDQKIQKPSILAAVDKELAKLDWQQMAYTAPDRMEIGSMVTVDVVLGGNRTFAELVPLFENAGKAEGQRVQVADRMEAKLTGSGFEIIATTPETQLVSTTQVTIWRWQVKAKDLGNQKLYLSLNALLSVNGKDTAKSIMTFQREISVQVTSVSGIWAFLERYWAYLTVAFTAVILPLFVYLWKKLTKADGAKPT